MAKKLQPFTLEHFERYASNIVLDTGDYWQLEDFQATIVEPLFQGVRENWAVVPEGNAKTTLIAGVALYFADYQPMPWIPIGASSRGQAEIVAKQAYSMIRQSPYMLKRFRIYEGYRKIVPIRADHPAKGAHGVEVYAADVTTGDGVIPTLALIDEGHRLPGMGLYRLWKGKLRKRQGQIMLTSTAGEPGSEFEEMRDAIKDAATEREVHTSAHTTFMGHGVVLNEWMVRRSEDATNPKKVKEANPLEQITEEDLAEDLDSPTVDLGDWKRLKCNIPARSQNAAISDQEYDDSQVQHSIPEGAHIDLGCDVAWKHDTFAITPCWQSGQTVEVKVKTKDGFKKIKKRRRLLGDPEILTPPRDGSTLHPDFVKDAFDRFLNSYNVETVVMDMERAEDIASWLEDERGVKVIDWSQGNAQAARDYEAFMRGLRDGTLKHTDHAGLRAHAMHAVARALPGDKRRFDRPSQSRAKKKQDERVIDALTAAAMVNSYLDEPPEEEHKFAGKADEFRISVIG
jgi:phage terminase large subunit-like protein